MTFLIFEDNGGGYHWSIVADGGEKLVLSAGFGSHEEAEQAARIVHRGASSASFEDRPGDTPPVATAAGRDTGRSSVRERPTAVPGAAVSGPERAP